MQLPELFARRINHEVYQLVTDYQAKQFMNSIEGKLFPIFPVEVTKTQDPPKELEQYYSFEISTPRFNSFTQKCEVSVAFYFDENKLKREWDLVREKRNKLLQESDWHLSSMSVPQPIKRRIDAYKEVLRDIPQIYEYPHQVVFPDIPYESTLETAHADLEEWQVEKIKNHVPANVTNWNKFLKAWKDTNFTKKYKVVNNLCIMYCPLLRLDTVLYSTYETSNVL